MSLPFDNQDTRGGAQGGKLMSWYVHPPAGSLLVQDLGIKHESGVRLLYREKRGK